MNVVVLFFAIKWVPRFPRQAVPILALQIAAALAAVAPVFLLHWEGRVQSRSL